MDRTELEGAPRRRHTAAVGPHPGHSTIEGHRRPDCGAHLGGRGTGNNRSGRTRPACCGGRWRDIQLHRCLRFTHSTTQWRKRQHHPVGCLEWGERARGWWGCTLLRCHTDRAAGGTPPPPRPAPPPPPGAPPPVPQAAPRPALDEGPHLSYALQWFVFATMGFVGLGWAANRERTTELELRDTHNNSRDAAAAVRVHGGTVFSANGAPTPSGTPIGNFPEELPSVEARAPSGAPRYPRPITRHRAKKVNVDSEYEDSVLDSATHTR